MKFIILKSTAILIAIWAALYPNASEALVAQNASSALRSDIFVKESRPDRKAIEKRQKEREKRRQEEQKQREKALKEAQKRQELQQKLNTLKENEREKQLNDTTVSQDAERQKNEIENQLRQLENSAGKTAGTSSSKDVSYTKSYASKLFQTYSGHITIEQKNIPKKIAVTKGSTIQLNLENKPETIWYIVNDDKVAKIKTNKENGSVRNVILEASGKGSTMLILDNILTKDNDYKVLTTKRMRLIVDDAK